MDLHGVLGKNTALALLECWAAALLRPLSPTHTLTKMGETLTLRGELTGHRGWCA